MPGDGNGKHPRRSSVYRIHLPLLVSEGTQFCAIRSHLQNAGFVMVKRATDRSISGASSFTRKGNRVGMAGPIAIVSGWPPRPAWLHPVKSASVQSDLALLLFRLLRHDLDSLINPRRKTPRLARAYYKHLVNEWKLNKSRLKIAGILGTRWRRHPRSRWEISTTRARWASSSTSASAIARLDGSRLASHSSRR
jgi:hypothetical protein